jgi:hypothetical protein
MVLELIMFGVVLEPVPVHHLGFDLIFGVNMNPVRAVPVDHLELRTTVGLDYDATLLSDLVVLY